MKKLVLTATLALASCVTAQTALPENPRPVKTLDKPFIFSTISDAAFMSADMGLSISRISHSHNPCVYEIDPIFGSRHPSPGDYAKVQIPITIGTAFLSYELKKHNSRIWALPQAIHSIFSFTGIISNATNKENWPCHLTR